MAPTPENPDADKDRPNEQEHVAADGNGDTNDATEAGHQEGEATGSAGSRTGVIATVAVVAAMLVGVFVVTGFWQPGFLTSSQDSEGKAAPPPAEQSQPAPQSAPNQSGQPGQMPGQSQAPPADPADEKEVRLVAKKVAEGYNDRDIKAFKKQTCKPDDFPDDAFKKAGKDEKLEVAGDPVIQGKKAQVPVKATAGGQEQQGALPMAKEGDRWCVSMSR